MNQIIGKIQIERTPDGDLAIRQNWNPSQLTETERDLAGQEIAEAGEQMRVGNFEHGGEYCWCRPASGPDPEVSTQ